MNLSDIPLLVSVNHQLAYALVPVPGHYLVIGPVQFDVKIYFHRQFTTGEACQDDCLDTVYKCDFREFTKYVLLAYNLFLEQPIERYDLYTFNCLNPAAGEETQQSYSRLLFQNREQEKRHNPYDQEVREMLSIEMGDLEGLKKSIQEDFVGDFGTIAKEPLRNHKNFGIAVVAIACRAAIRGGLLPELAFSLSDSYILKIEETNDMPTLTNLIRGAEFQYTRMVKELHDMRTGNVEKDVNLHISRYTGHTLNGAAAKWLPQKSVILYNPMQFSPPTLFSQSGKTRSS